MKSTVCIHILEEELGSLHCCQEYQTRKILHRHSVALDCT